MAEAFMTDPFEIKLKNMMKLEGLQQDKDMIIQQNFC